MIANSYILSHWALIVTLALYFVHTCLYAPGVRPACGVAALVTALCLFLGL